MTMVRIWDDDIYDDDVGGDDNDDDVENVCGEKSEWKDTIKVDHVISSDAPLLIIDIL